MRGVAGRAGAAAAIGVVLAGCGPKEVEGLPTVEGAPVLVVTGTDFAFSPAELSLDAGDAVNIRFEVTDGGHNFVVADAAGTEAQFALPIVDEGEWTAGALTIDEPGTYTVVCTVPGHLAAGMTGTVVVE